MNKIENELITQQLSGIDLDGIWNIILTLKFSKLKRNSILIC